MADKDDPNGEILANAVRVLREEHENEAAALLLASLLCFHDDDSGEGFIATLISPPRVYEVLSADDPNWTREVIWKALAAVFPEDITGFGVTAGRVVVERGAEPAVADRVEAGSITNQLAEADTYRTWNNLRFRSASEVRISAALDKTGALFFPNCRCRLTTPDGERKNVEPDFLVLYQGKWGILEVDGEPFHPPSRTVHDHERDRLFNNYRILVTQHFDADECFENAEGVVRKFLDILKKS